MKNKGKTVGIIKQVALLFLVSILSTGLLTFLSQRMMAKTEVRQQTESIAATISQEMGLAIKEYPSYEWLMKYWHANWEEMDIEYDVDFSPGTKTEEKAKAFNEKHPDLQIKYITSEEAEKLSPEDQKAFAEICYSWLITRINEIKQLYDVDYLFCVSTDDGFKNQFFLFSAADPGAKRGTNYEEVYTLGVQSTVGESQEEAMRSAAEHSSHLADAGNYMDYYSYLDKLGEEHILIGLTYDLTDLRANSAIQTKQGTAFAVFHQIALAVLCLMGLFFFVLLPLKEVQKNIRLYKETKDSQEVREKLSEVKTKNEIGQLSMDVMELSTEMDEYINNIESITAERERIGTELSLATEIQCGMLPSEFPAFPDRYDFDIYGAMDPAKEVGGDFYDFFMIDEDHLCMVIADVSGKGIPAALFMMAAKIILANNAKMGKSPSEILRDTNASICSNNKGEMFVTVWLGILELSTGILKAANAGHEYPAIKHSGEDFQLYKDKHGFVIGGMDGMDYKEYEIKLEPGAKVFLYTDGVPEATNSENQLFGVERMIDALNKAKDETPEKVLSSIRKRVDEFVLEAEQFDDLTMLCLEYKGVN